MAKNRIIVIGVIVAVVVVLVFALGLGLGLGLKKDKQTTENTKDYYNQGAVAADATVCSEVGRNILQKGGHAVDASIATLLCVGVVNCHSTGVGGGGFMTVYDRKAKKSFVYDYRETAPSNIHSQIYDDDSKKAEIGGLAVGIPGEIRGLKKVHERYGKLEWSVLFEDAIRLAETGTRIGTHMANYLSSSENFIKSDAGLSEIFLHANGTIKMENDIVINKKLSKR